MEIGTDILEVSRIEKAIKNTKGFKEKVFTNSEILYAEKHKNKYQIYTGRFAAKEAFSKAYGTGFDGTFTFLDIEITNDEKGKPIMQVKNLKISGKIKLSISHTENYAVAFVILED